VTLDPSAVGDRIEQLLDASAAAGPVVHERAEELVRLVVELYGAGLERILELADGAGSLSDDLLRAMVDDELVSSLLLVHGLHPYGARQRVELAVDALGGVSLLEVTDDGVVRLALLGGCGAPSQETVEQAVRDAAPEVTSVEVVAAQPPVIPVDQLMARLA
jgi:hypothetical protein